MLDVRCFLFSDKVMASKSESLIRAALRLAQRGFGATSPNPMVGAILVKGGRIIGRGWHRQAGGPHAEIAALRDAEAHGHNAQGAMLYVTLEPCCTRGRTPPCTEAIIAAGIKHVVAGATDPNPRHRGKAFAILRRAGVAVTRGVLAEECEQLNEAFNHWIVHRTPFVTVKAAMTIDGKIATAAGESKWITGETARAIGMKLRKGADAILVGVNTILADDPGLTFRPAKKSSPQKGTPPRLRRIVLDTHARTPLKARIISDRQRALTTIVVGRSAPRKRVDALARHVNVLRSPLRGGRIDLGWLLQRLGAEEVTHLLVEGGGEVNASFLLQGLARRVVFFYAPKILGGRDSRKVVAGDGVARLADVIALRDIAWKKVGTDLMLTAAVA